MNSENPNNSGGLDPEELQKMLQQLFGTANLPDGMQNLPAELQKLFGAGNTPGDGSANSGIGGIQAFLNGMPFNLGAANLQPGQEWQAARDRAIQVAGEGELPDAEKISAVEAAIDSSLTLASAWLDAVTTMGAPADSPRKLDRVKWIVETFETWQALAEPVVSSVSAASKEQMAEALPEEMSAMLGSLQAQFENIARSMFAQQLGNAVGALAKEVFAGGDIGIPVFGGDGKTGGAFVATNIHSFADGLQQPLQDVALYLTVRELAYARLFRHAKWLRPHIIGAFTDYARGISVQASFVHDLAEQIDLSNPESLTEFFQSGEFIPPRSEIQEKAHERLGHLLALVEGWVDAVTASATAQLPGSEAIGEMIQRRRALGGPAEQLFSSLIGLQLRPRKLREAAQLWKLLEERGGTEARDRLWEHPDLLPTEAETDNHGALLERLGWANADGSQTDDEFDVELRKLLDGGFDLPPADGDSPEK